MYSSYHLHIQTVFQTVVSTSVKTTADRHALLECRSHLGLEQLDLFPLPLSATQSLCFCRSDDPVHYQVKNEPAMTHALSAPAAHVC